MSDIIQKIYSDRPIIHGKSVVGVNSLGTIISRIPETYFFEEITSLESLLDFRFDDYYYYGGDLVDDAEPNGIGQNNESIVFSDSLSIIGGYQKSILEGITLSDFFEGIITEAPADSNIIVFDDWSGTGSVGGTSPDTGPIGETWNILNGAFVKLTGDLHYQPISNGEVGGVIIETNESDVIINTIANVGTFGDGGGHSRILPRTSAIDNTLICYIAEDVGVAIATFDGNDFNILQSDAQTVDQNTNYDMTVMCSGDFVSLRVVGGSINTTISTTTTFNNTVTTHGVGAFNGSDVVTADRTWGDITISGVF